MADAPQEMPRRRWFRITPDRAVLGLLAAELLLLLSERCQWFAFNRHRGWTALVAVEVVAATLLLMVLWFGVSLVLRSPFQFSIRSLLLLALIIAIPCAWLAPERQRARKQRDAVEQLEKAGATVAYGWERDPAGNPIDDLPPGRPWLPEILGDDVFYSVKWVDFTRAEVGDGTLRHLEGLTQLRALTMDYSGVGDAGLQHLEGLTQLRDLLLGFTQISDAGLVHLKGLTRLEVLEVDGTKISDAGLQHLQGLTRLQKLFLTETKVSDAGLKYLKGLTQLEVLDLGETAVTAAGVRDLQKALPRTKIRGPTTP